MLTTESSIPAPAPHELRRERLLSRLRAHSACRLVLIVAPAGFGKTTLAATYARETDVSAAWLTLQPSHANPTHFFTDLATAVESSVALPRLRQGLADGAEGIALARRLADDMREAATELTLVLDDLNTGLELSEPEQSIEVLLQHLPPWVQVLITSRETPGLSATQLLSNDGILVIGPEELRFTPEETLELRSVLGHDSTSDDRAGGWVAGILLGDAPRHLGDSGGKLLGAYVERAVLARLRPRERQWLEALAAVETITPSAATRVIGPGSWVPRLVALAERCPFLVQVEPVHYRLHALVRDTLLERLRRSGARAVRVWTAARALAEEAHDTPAIVRTSVELGDLAIAVEVVREAASEATRVGRWSLALQTLKLLPNAAREANPALLLIEAHALMQVQRPDEALPVAQAALEHGGRSGDAQVQISALLELAGIARYTGDAAAMDDRLAAADYVLRHNELPAHTRRWLEGRLWGIRGLWLGVRGEMREARASLETAERLLTQLGRTRELGVVLANLAVATMRAGDYAEAQRALAAATALWRTLGDRTQLALTQIVHGNLQLRLGQLEAAGGTLSSALGAARMTGAVRTETYVLASIAMWHRANGRLADAAEALDQSLSLAEELAEREPLVEALRLKAELAVFNRDLGAAHALLSRAQAEGQLMRSNFQLAGIERALGRLYLAEGSAERAIQHFEVALDRFEHSSGPDEVTVTLYWLGTAYLVHRNTRQAEDALRRAVELAHNLAAPEILATPAAEDLTLLRHGLRIGHHAAELARVERLAVTRQPWHVAPTSAPVALERASAMPRVEVRLLGPYLLHVNGQLVDTGARGTSRTHELLALLLLHPDGLTAPQISELLWPDKPVDRAQANVQMTAYLLRKLLGTRLAVPHVRGRYTLAPELVAWSDIQFVDESVKRAPHAQPDDARRLLQEAVDAYRGDLLCDMPWDWVDPFRARHRKTIIDTLLRLVDLIPREDTRTWRELIERTLNLEPDNETAFERLLGNARARGDALTESTIQRRYTAVMQRLGLPPNPRLTASA